MFQTNLIESGGAGLNYLTSPGECPYAMLCLEISMLSSPHCLSNLLGVSFLAKRTEIALPYLGLDTLIQFLRPPEGSIN